MPDVKKKKMKKYKKAHTLKVQAGHLRSGSIWPENPQPGLAGCIRLCSLKFQVSQLRIPSEAPGKAHPAPRSVLPDLARF